MVQNEDVIKLLRGAAATPSAAQAAYDETNKKDPATVWEFFNKRCRNCYLGGKGVQDHRFGKCQSMGNPCFVPCYKCNKGKRWASDCPNK